MNFARKKQYNNSPDASLGEPPLGRQPALWEYDPVAGFGGWEYGMARLCGLEGLGSVTHSVWESQVEPADLATIAALAQEALESGRPTRLRYRIRLPATEAVREIELDLEPRAGSAWPLVSFHREVVPPAQWQSPAERFACVAGLSGTWYWEQDRDLRFSFVSVNPPGDYLLGPTGSLGRTRFELPLLWASDDLREHHRRTLEAREPFRDLLLSSASSERHFLISGEPVLSESREFLGYRGVGREVTQDHQTGQRLRASEERFRSLVALSSDWYWEQDSDFRLTSHIGGGARVANPETVAKMLGKTRREGPFTGKTPHEWDEHDAMLERHESFRDFELTRLDPDGHIDYVNLSGAPFFDGRGRFLGYRGVGRDITERKEAELALSLAHKALHEERASLSARVAQRTAQLDLARQAAEQANAAKSEFLATLSHELRTPMHAILSFAGLALERSARTPGDGARLSRHLNHIGQSAERLLRLLDQLLDLSKLEANHAAISACRTDVRTVLDAVESELCVLATNRGLRVSRQVSAADTHAWIDAQAFQHALQNLLSNAIAFSPDNGVITVGIDAVELVLRDGTTAPALRIGFRDQGIEILDEECSRIFDKFPQGARTPSRVSGTGLGLAIARKIVHQHRGSIGARNHPEGGALFEVCVPREAGAAPQSAGALLEALGTPTD